MNGRAHPEDPDLAIHGHSIGRWDGGMHIAERIRLSDADTLAVELTITAPEVLTRPWKDGRAQIGRRAAALLKLGPLRDGAAGGIFIEATPAGGKVMTYSTELPTE